MEIKNYRDGAQGSNIICIFDIWLPNVGMTLHEWKCIRKKTGGWFVSPPSFCVERDGKKNWNNYITFSEARRIEFFDKIQEMLKGIIKE